MRVTPLSNHVSSACSCTSDCTNIVEAVGSIPTAEIDAGQLPGLGRQDLGDLRHCDGVQIDDAEEALVLTLQRHPVAQRAEIISQMNVAGWLGAAEDSFHF